MPRVRHIHDDPCSVADAAPVLARLGGRALRLRRLHELLSTLRLEDEANVPEPSWTEAPRYVVVLAYADDGRGCDLWVKWGDSLPDLLKSPDNWLSGWIPIALHDLDEDKAWRITMRPTFDHREPLPQATTDAAWSAIRALAVACGAHERQADESDAAASYTSMLERVLATALAAGWSA